MNRFEETKKAGLFGIIGNIFLLIIKGTVGFVFKITLVMEKQSIYFLCLSPYLWL